MSQIKSRFGRERIEKLLHGNNIAVTIEALTESEGQALLRFKSFDSLRDRISQEDRAFFSRTDIGPQSEHQVRQSLSATSGPGQITDRSRHLYRALAKYFKRAITEGTITHVEMLHGDAGMSRRLGSIFKKDIVFFHASDPQIDQDGITLPSDSGVIFINANASNPCLAITGFELAHTLKGDNPDLYNKLVADIIPEMVNDKAVEFQGKLSESRAKEGHGSADEDLTIEEMLGNLLGGQVLKLSSGQRRPASPMSTRSYNLEGC